jgi:Spy/CpxP family protein refolding chaperone
MTVRHWALAFLVAAGGLAAAPPAAHPGGDRVVMRFDRVLAELELSEDQRQRVVALRDRFEAEMGALAKALHHRAEDLRGRLEETPGEPRTIDDLVQEIGRLQTEILRVRVRAIRDLREALSARQQLRLKELEESLRRARGPAPSR